MQPIDILARIDRFDDAGGVDLARERQLHEDAVDLVIGVEALDEREKLRQARGGGELVLEGAHARFDRLARLVGHIDAARRIVADEHDRKARRCLWHAFSAATRAATLARSASAIALPSMTRALMQSPSSMV